jgi:hypothetical protein
MTTPADPTASANSARAGDTLGAARRSISFHFIAR